MQSLTALLDSRILSLPCSRIVLIYSSVLLLLAVLSLLRRYLTLSGVAGAVVLGAITLWITGFSGFSVLLLFFLSSSLVSKWRGSGNTLEEKGARRDLSQVLANGLPGALCLLLSRLPHSGYAAVVAFSAAAAEAAADTWSGSIGMRSKRPPVSIVTGMPVPPGLSGGVTPLGFLGGLAGALLVAAMHTYAFGGTGMETIIVAASGFMGSVADSFLGATVQERFRDSGGNLTEKRISGGRGNRRAGGIPGFDNDLVNLFSGLLSASLALGMATLVL